MTPLGDAGPFAWGVTLLYALASWRCGRASGDAAGRGAWRMLAIVLLALGINKQLDAQTLLIEGLRDAARAGGWYRDRRALQAVALGVGAAALTVLFAVLLARWRQQRHRDAALGLAGVGFGLLAMFVALRATRILHGPGGMLLPSAWLHDLLEPAALLLILVGAERAIRRASSSSAPRADARSTPRGRS